MRLCAYARLCLCFLPSVACQKLLAGETPTSSAEPQVEPSSSAPAHSATPAQNASAREVHAPSAAHRDHPWTYTGDKGPAHWGELDAKWEGCKVGKQQSPIDLPLKAESPKTVETLTIDYVDVPLRIKNNGHTIEVVNQSDSFITVGHKRYDLLQFHFHSPSEHTVAGERYPLEVHFVHKAADGELAVVGALFQLGEVNTALADLWKKAPKHEVSSAIEVARKTLDVSSLLTTREGYYAYPGSLTTPPCSEGVRWFVLKAVHEIDKKTVDNYRTWFGGRTNRPIQPLLERAVSLISR